MTRFIDFDQSTYEDWLFFVFQQPENYCFGTYRGKGGRILRFLSQFFAEPEVIREAFTPQAINTGLIYLPSADGFIRYLYDSTIPLTERKSCASGMKNLFDTIFAFPEYFNYGQAGRLWWDSVFRNVTAPNGNTLANEPEILAIYRRLIYDQKLSVPLSLQLYGQVGIELLNQFEA